MITCPSCKRTYISWLSFVFHRTNVKRACTDNLSVVDGVYWTEFEWSRERPVVHSPLYIEKLKKEWGFKGEVELEQFPEGKGLSPTNCMRKELGYA